MISGFLDTRDYIHFQIVDTHGETLHTFVGAASAIPCLPGDTCKWSDEKCTLVTRKKHIGLVGNLHLQSKYRYGMTSRGVPIYLFTPQNRGYPPLIVGCSRKETDKNVLTIVDFEDWGNLKGHPRGNLREVLGECGEYDVEKKALVQLASPYKIPKDWSDTEECISDIDISDRIELPENTFHIDPSGCKDIDDVVSIEYVENQTYIWITISDVSEIIKEGSKEDILASQICQTTYSLDGEALKPMLPSHYSENICSLLPGKKRLGISLRCLILPDGNLAVQNVYKTVVRVTKSYSYESVYDDALFPKQLFMKITHAILGNSANHRDSHTWIEALMIFYNRYVGSILKELGSGVLRSHAGSDPSRENLLRMLSDETLLAYANYAASYVDAGTSADTTHKALGITTYCHATSPIRRYADLVNQRVFKTWISGQKTQVVYNIYQLQTREKENKQYSHHCQFLELLQGVTDSKIVVQVLALEAYEEGRIRLTAWIPSWKRILSFPMNGMMIREGKVCVEDVVQQTKNIIQIQDTLSLNYKTFPQQARWVDRILFQLVHVEHSIDEDKVSPVESHHESNVV